MKRFKTIRLSKSFPMDMVTGYLYSIQIHWFHWANRHLKAYKSDLDKLSCINCTRETQNKCTLSRIEDKQFHLTTVHIVRAQNFTKTYYCFTPILKGTCAYQEIRNVSSTENFAYVLSGWSLIALAEKVKWYQNYKHFAENVTSLPFDQNFLVCPYLQTMSLLGDIFPRYYHNYKKTIRKAERNPLQSSVAFLYPQNTSENQKVFWGFQGV